MVPREKALFLLSEMNNARVTPESFKKASYYGQQELKRKCLVAVDEIINNCKLRYDQSSINELHTYLKINLTYWKEVKEEIEKL